MDTGILQTKSCVTYYNKPLQLHNLTRQLEKVTSLPTHKYVCAVWTWSADVGYSGVRLWPW